MKLYAVILNLIISNLVFKLTPNAIYMSDFSSHSLFFLGVLRLGDLVLFFMIYGHPAQGLQVTFHANKVVKSQQENKVMWKIHRVLQEKSFLPLNSSALD